MSKDKKFPENKLVLTHLHQAKSLTSRDNPKWKFFTGEGIFTTETNAQCAYKGEPKHDQKIALVLNEKGKVIDYAWENYSQDHLKFFDAWRDRVINPPEFAWNEFEKKDN